MQNSRTKLTKPGPKAASARTLMEQVAQLVQCSSWAFAAFTDSEISDLYTSASAIENDRLIELLSTEQAQQSATATGLPRVTRTKVALAPYTSGVTLAFGPRRIVTALLVLMREPDEPSFTQTEMSALQASLDPIAHALGDLSMFADDASAQARLGQRTPPAQYVLARDFTVEYAYEPANQRFNFVLKDKQALVPAIESTVRTLVSTWTDAPETWTESAAMPLPQVALRVFPLSGPGDPRIGVSVERFGARNSLAWAAQRFAISTRELQVLALILQGLGTPEIAANLQIAESTAHDHIKRMLLKTKARNRAEMVAKTLGWRAEEPG